MPPPGVVHRHPAMFTSMLRRGSLPAVITLCCVTLHSTAEAQGRQGGGAPVPDSARKKVLVVAGQRAGPSAFPYTDYPETRPLVPGVMDFKHYHTSEEIEWWMRKWATDHPNLVELYEVGQSFGGRPIMQMTITSKTTGRHSDKPAAFFEGGRHSGEITATESAFYLAWYVLENYAKDATVKKLLDEKALYIKPLNNP